MAVGVQKAWSVTAADNATADTNINYAEGQTPASLNNSARADMAAIKGWCNQISGAKTTGGSANAQTLTSDSVAAISTAYAAGMIFCVKAGYTNSTTTPTFNVDGVGAKTIKKGGAQAALAAGDMTAGGIYWLAYEASGDCFLLLNPDSGSVSSQPLDADLTAIAATSYSSGNMLLQKTAADTWSVTLTPSVSSITASQGAAATTPSANFINTNNSASVRVARYESDRASPAQFDVSYNSYFMSNGSGTQIEYARDSTLVITATAGSEDGFKRMSLMKAGVLTNVFEFYHGYFAPSANDLVPLGATTLSWSDLFLASGAVINFNNGNYTLTHSTGLLAASGAIQARVPLSSETSGTLSSASANKKVVCAGNITLNDGVFTADDFILFDPGTSARTFTRDTGATMYVNGTDSASATLAANQMGTAHWRTNAVAVLAGAFS